MRIPRLEEKVLATEEILGLLLSSSPLVQYIQPISLNFLELYNVYFYDCILRIPITSFSLEMSAAIVSKANEDEKEDE